MNYECMWRLASFTIFYLFYARLIRVVEGPSFNMFWHKLAANPWELVPAMENSQCHVLLQTCKSDCHKCKDGPVMFKKDNTE